MGTARIRLIATGGTIAMSRKKAGFGATLTKRADDLLRSLPRLDGIADVDAVDVLGKPSVAMGLEDLAEIARAVESAAADGRAAVITHGSDTIEETAVGLALTVANERPIVLTAAMRPQESPGADGAANLLAAIRVAASDIACGLEPLLVADDEIHIGRFVRKSHSFRIHAFSSAPLGPVGWVAEDRVRIWLRPSDRLPRLRFGPHAVAVPILEVGPSLEVSVVTAFSKARIGGLVLSLPGAGHVAEAAVPALAGLASRIPVIFASRTGAGETLIGSYGFRGSETDLLRHGLIGAGPLDARKARIALQLLLSDNANIPAVNRFFTTTSAIHPG
jgi:L-asparaginase